jgi:hypothetical protein
MSGRLEEVSHQFRRVVFALEVNGLDIGGDGTTGQQHEEEKGSHIDFASALGWLTSTSVVW